MESSQISKCIEDLPNEILEQILESLLTCKAGYSFMKCRAVCKLWKDTVEKGVLKNPKLNEKVWFNVCNTSLARNTALEFLNIGPSRFRGSDEDRATELLDESNFPQDFPLYRLHKIDSNNTELRYEDGSSPQGFSKWRRLFYHCFALATQDVTDAGIGSVKQEAMNFRTDNLDSEAVTSMKISGQIIITGHSTGSIWFWTLSGNCLDCIPPRQSRNEVRGCVRSLSLIDAYQHGRYNTQDVEGRDIYTEHHAIAILSTTGDMYLCALQINGSNANSEAQSRCKLINATRQMQISSASSYGDLIVAATNVGEVLLFRMSTDDKYRSKPAETPFISMSKMFSLSGGPYQSYGPQQILDCNIWNLPGSESWSRHSVMLIKHTGEIIRCFLPNQDTMVVPEWRKFATLDKQDGNKNGEETLLFEKSFLRPRLLREELISNQPFHIIDSLENLTQTAYPAKVKRIMMNGNSFASVFGKNIYRIVQIEKVEYVVQPYEDTCKALGIQRFPMPNVVDVFELCSIFRDDLFILITRKTKQMLASVDGFYYKSYSPMQMQSFYGSYITTAYYTSNILILGLSNGGVRAYIVPGKAGILNLDLDKPAWIVEAGKWSFGSPVIHIHVGMYQEYKDTHSDLHSNLGKVVIVAAHDDNSVTVIKRSLKIL